MKRQVFFGAVMGFGVVVLLTWLLRQHPQATSPETGNGPQGTQPKSTSQSTRDAMMPMPLKMPLKAPLEGLRGLPLNLVVPPLSQDGGT